MLYNCKRYVRACKASLTGRWSSTKSERESNPEFHLQSLAPQPLSHSTWCYLPYSSNLFHQHVAAVAVEAKKARVKTYIFQPQFLTMLDLFFTGACIWHSFDFSIFKNIMLGWFTSVLLTQGLQKFRNVMVSMLPTAFLAGLQFFRQFFLVSFSSSDIFCTLLKLHIVATRS